MGQFALKDLDPELVFRLLAVAEGYTPSLQAKNVDPSAGPVKFTLTPHDLDKRAPTLVLRGRVLDEQGTPIPEAVVEPFGFRKGDSGQFGGLTGFDPLTVTNKAGEFRLGVPDAEVAVYVQVSAPFKSNRIFKMLKPGPKSHDLTLLAGVTIIGRLVKNGKPLAGVAVGTIQKDRNVESFVGEFKAATDARGKFEIRNVPPEETLSLYGLMESLQEHGALGVRDVNTAKSGSISDVGDLEVTAGYKVTGTVVLADGKPVPAGTRVVLGREEAWDVQQAVVDDQGRFTLTGLPSEHYGLSVNVRGYRLSSKNASLDVFGGSRLIGVVRADTDGLRVLLESGARHERPEFNQELAKEYDRRRNAPLGGAPAEK